jgi:hypothetical protein
MSPWVVLRAHPVIHTIEETPRFGTMNDRARTVVHIQKSSSEIHMSSHQWIYCEKLCRRVFSTKASVLRSRITVAQKIQASIL